MRYKSLTIVNHRWEIRADCRRLLLKKYHAYPDIYVCNCHRQRSEHTCNCIAGIYVVQAKCRSYKLR